MKPLREIIAATTIGLKTFLVTEFGKPFADAGFGNKFRDWCNDAGLPRALEVSVTRLLRVSLRSQGRVDDHARAQCGERLGRIDLAGALAEWADAGIRGTIPRTLEDQRAERASGDDVGEVT